MIFASLEDARKAHYESWCPKHRIGYDSWGCQKCWEDMHNFDGHFEYRSEGLDHGKHIKYFHHLQNIFTTLADFELCKLV